MSNCIVIKIKNIAFHVQDTHTLGYSRVALEVQNELEDYFDQIGILIPSNFAKVRAEKLFRDLLEKKSIVKKKEINFSDFSFEIFFSEIDKEDVFFLSASSYLDRVGG